MFEMGDWCLSRKGKGGNRNVQSQHRHLSTVKFGGGELDERKKEGCHDFNLKTIFTCVFLPNGERELEFCLMFAHSLPLCKESLNRHFAPFPGRFQGLI